MGAYDDLLTEIHDKDPELAHLILNTVEVLALQLGESPEAWRGAEATADMVTGILKVAAETFPRDQRPLIFTVIQTVVFALSIHPLTPFGVAERKEGLA